MVRVATYIVTQTRMLLRAKEHAMNIYAWITGEIWNCPWQMEIDGHPIRD